METVQTCDLAGFRVHLKTFVPGFECRWPQHVDGRLCVFLDGSMCEDRTRYVTSDVVYKPPEDRPALRFGEHGARTVTVELRTAGIDLLRSAGFETDEPFSLRSAQCHGVAERVRAELVQRDEMTPLVLEGLVLDLFARTYRESKTESPPRWLEDVRRRIESSFSRPWTLRDYAEHANVHPVQLASRFRRHYRCTVGEHIRALRLAFAMQELTATRKPIAEIAIEAGFSDQSHLSRALKKQTGLSPGRFRRASG